MKKILFILPLLFAGYVVHGKIVKFSVDMTGQVIDSMGVHITGDFQAAAGFPGGDWLPGTTPMTNDSGSNIYSVVVNIPAFAKYEYKFLNGNQTYNVEFVPIPSRVNDIANDNRWIYIDSLDSDTMQLAPILFSANAPAGKYLLRLKVDMQLVPLIDPAGVHVTGSFQGMDPAITRLYSFDGNVFQYIAYTDTLNSAIETEYKFVNGNVALNEETVPGGCSNGDMNRSIFVTMDTVPGVVCYEECLACTPAGTSTSFNQEGINIYPNPAQELAFFDSDPNENLYSLTLINDMGQVIRNIRLTGSQHIPILREGLSSGIYYVKAQQTSGKCDFLKLMFE